MNADVRLSAPEDYDDFMQLAADYLVELRSLGSEVKPTPQSLALYRHLFHMYTLPVYDANGEQIANDGVIVLAGSPAYAFSVAGEVGPVMFPMETDFGRTAYGHGTYVKPAHRGKSLSTVLRDKVREVLKERGYETIVGGVHLKNDLGAASLKHSTFTWYQLVGYERL